MKPNKLALALAGLLLTPLGTVSAQTTAPVAPADSAPPQDQQPPDQQQAQQLQTITVTGSAIPRIDMETPSPVTVITAAQIQRSGLKTVSDVVRAISADNSGSIPTAFTAGFAAGSAGVALRGLTVNSTLVLIDGRRSANYPLADDGQRTFVDLNTIPVNAIERIDVLKDGASSLYGADAIAGVVNIILKHDYKGLEGTAEVGTSQQGGGTTRRATLLFGGGDLQKNGWNAYGSVEAQKDDRIWARDRGYPYNAANLNPTGGSNFDWGQPGFNNGSIYPMVQRAVLGPNGPGGMLTGTAAPGALWQPLVPCGPGTTPITNAEGSGCEQNQINYLDLQPKQERVGVYGRLTLKVGDSSEAYVSGSYYTNKVEAAGTPPQIRAGTPVNTRSILLPATLPDGSDNPNNPFPNDPALITYAFGGIPGGGKNENHNLRIAGGIHGIWGEWNYDSALVFSHNTLDVDNYGFLNYAALINAVNNGTYNFVDPSQNSPELLAQLAPVLHKRSTTDLQSIDFHVSRPLADLAGGSLGLATGIDVRHEQQHDPDLNPGLQAQGLGVAHTFGSRTVEGLYAELDAPFLESLEVDVSGRFDHYSDFGNNFSPKVGFKWKPIESLAVRGTWSKGFRAPSFAENGSSESEGFATYNLPDDYAAAHGNNAYVRPYGLAYDTIGNPNIQPEKSKSWTFGVLWQPLDQFSASVDYYDIKKTGVIGQFDTQAVLDAYFAGQPLPPGSAIIPDVPDPQFPTLLPKPVVVMAPYVNQNALQTKGVDLDLIGNFDLGGNVKLRSEFNATRIFEWNLTLQDGTVERFVGTHGPYALSSGAGTPRDRASWSNSLTFGQATVTGTLYYTSAISMSAPDNGEGCISTDDNGNPFPPSCHVASFTYFDLTGSYDFNDHFGVYASVLNAFNRKAPFDPANYASNNYNPTWAQPGMVGRFYTVGVRYKM
ncbi:TonB-dependent receptor plug domain-containing protein [Frateuria sp. YIM B11624]|uniref:TonB-dependent receptor plug domain-containing protein n=1 Tax=Frateuria sp. YIM B11624 TaxID=3143185 RepID=UPI003C74DA82